MMLGRMDEKTYAEHWEFESNQLEYQGIYKRLSEIAPTQSVVEIGCGVGFATYHLAANRKILSIDNNIHFIEKTKSRLEGAGLDVKIIHADLFDLSSEQILAIKDFSPKGIIKWFIGSHFDDIDKRIPVSTPLNERPKKYRESIEDFIVSDSFCLQSVEWIHFVTRAAMKKTASADSIFDEVKRDYDTHVFSQNGFEVVDVQSIEWNRAGSSFLYVNPSESDFISNNEISYAISILAKRIDK